MATSPNTANTLSCTYGTFDATTLYIDTAASTNTTCWPLTATAYLGVRRSYTASATDSSSCTKGLQALQLVQWLATNSSITATTDYQQNPRPAELSFIYDDITNVLNSITCDGTTMLITLPNIWSLSAGVAGFGIAFAVLGLLGIIASLVVVAMYHSHPVIKSASTWFVFTSMFGVGLMFASIFFLVSDVNSANCAAFDWFLNVGFTMTFAPLLAKTWRIYRIFGRKKLSVVKVTNRKLGVIVATIITCELIIMSLWQGISPLQPVVSTDYSGTTYTQYTECSTVDEGSNFLIAVAVMKASMLLYGAILAFSTRRVTDHFNESQIDCMVHLQCDLFGWNHRCHHYICWSGGRCERH